MANLPFGPLLASVGWAGEEIKNLSLRLLHYERENIFSRLRAMEVESAVQGCWRGQEEKRLVGGTGRGSERRWAEIGLVS